MLNLWHFAILDDVFNSIFKLNSYERIRMVEISEHEYVLFNWITSFLGTVLILVKINYLHHCLTICIYFRKFAFSKFMKLKIIKIMSMRSAILS